MQPPDKHGFILSFREAAPESLVHYQLGLARWTAAESPRGKVWLYGELLSYQGEGDFSACLNRVLADWQNGALKYEALNGRFVLIFCDSQSREWLLITDRIGAMHSYMVKQGEHLLAIGSDLATLAQQASTRQLDWEGIASLFTFGFFLDDRTYFADVRILLPRSIYLIDPSGALLEHRFYWNWHHRVDATRSYDETVEVYDRLLRQAVQRSVAHNTIALPISGGLDSRSLASVLPGSAKVIAYSYGYTSNSIELFVAAQVARARSLPFTSHIIQPYLFDRLHEIVLALHGSQDVTQARQTSVNGWVQDRAEVALTGLWGDVWCDQMGLADGLPEGMTLTDHAMKKFHKPGAWLLDNICAAQLSREHINQYLAESVSAGLNEFNAIADLDFQMKAYKTSRWAFRWSNASLRGFEIGAAPRIPYYDTALVDFFCTMPTSIARDRRLQIDHLKRYDPALARIRWQGADANLYLAKYGYWLGLPRRAVSKAHRMFTRQQVWQRNWEVQFLCARGQEGLQDWLLTPQLKLHSFVAPDALRTLIKQFYARPDRVNGYTVSMLLTFSAWLEAVL